MVNERIRVKKMIYRASNGKEIVFDAWEDNVMNMVHTGRIFARSAAKSSEIFWMGKSVMAQVVKLVAISAAVRTEMQRHMLTFR